MRELETFMRLVESKAGCPYVWGADGPGEFDCSGLIVWGLQQIGLLARGEDRHSTALAVMGRQISVEEGITTRGAFLWTPTHIAISRGDGTTIEARNPDLGVGIFPATGRGWTGANILNTFTQGGSMVTMASPAVGMVASEYGWRPRLSVNIPAMLHAGIDIANQTGTPVYAAYAGVVEKAGWAPVAGRSGNGILIRNPDGERQYYGHLSAIQVMVGQQVALGQQIGLMGATGNVTGPHLHFECWDVNGKTRNPREDFATHGVIIGSTTGQGAPTPTTTSTNAGDENGDGKITYYERSIDGDFGGETVKGLQEFLRDRHVYAREIDGQPGRYTWQAWQQWLQTRGFYVGYTVDGDLGYYTVYETQRYLQSLGQYAGCLLDGQFGGETIKALQRVLATTRKG
ncbi:peptidoglycan DD-metalloendopeptidase family protein [Trueperella sp. LYQ143]|uniref:peptidoglycan DD-metalloendopeptidase family protein n=1 Tax=Trueperella sp. LYQ143 TaxID=3391059 RepID=UPI003982F806